MLTETQEGRTLINEVAYRLVSENAPEELPLYVTTRDRYFDDPEGFGQPDEAEDEALGFGAAAAVETFTRVLFPVIAPVLAHVVGEVTKALKDEGGKKAVDWVRDLFTSPKPQPVFTQAELAEIQEQIQSIADKEARRLGLKKSQVLGISDAIIAKLALAQK